MHTLRLGTFVLGVSCLALLAVGAQHAPRSRAHTGPDDWGAPQAAELFAQGCSACHAVPDPRHERDRAWLGRVPETA